MLTHQTVLILGAGAHCSYGYPSGKQLIKDVITKVKDLVRSGDLHGLVELRHATIHEINEGAANEFVTALENCGQASIDAFLHAYRHKRAFNTIGKAAIAQVLIDYDHGIAERNVDASDNWLEYLFQHMLDGISNPKEFIEKNPISFVSFNYDTFLEKWLLNKIQHSFGIDPNESQSILFEIPIFHIYGSIKPFKPSTFRSNLFLDVYRDIHTIFEIEQNHLLIEEAISSIFNAQKIGLLGFGYHRENIALLKLEERTKLEANCIASTRFEVTDHEWTRHTKMLHPNSVIKTGEKQKNLDLLRHTPLL